MAWLSPIISRSLFQRKLFLQLLQPIHTHGLQSLRIQARNSHAHVYIHTHPRLAKVAHIGREQRDLTLLTLRCASPVDRIAIDMGSRSCTFMQGAFMRMHTSTCIPDWQKYLSIGRDQRVLTLLPLRSAPPRDSAHTVPIQCPLEKHTVPILLQL